MALRTGLSSISDGSMRFRWQEENTNRIRFFDGLDIRQPVFGNDVDDDGREPFLNPKGSRTLISLELIHSHYVYDISCTSDGRILITDDEGMERCLEGLQGDGYITKDPRLVPCVTVADCMPLWFSDEVTGVFGVVHSGWKGTGIIVDALKLAEKNYGTRKEDVQVTMGPHIHNCCYNIDPERVAFFNDRFGEDCITLRNGVPYLSLEQANLNALAAYGVPRDHITTSDACTCCATEPLSLSKGPDAYLYGSFRRQTAGLPADMPFEEKSKRFTVMAAFAVKD